MDIADRRREYTRETLDEGAAARNPFDQFRSWFDAALASELREPTAMALATVAVYRPRRVRARSRSRLRPSAA